MVERMTSVEIEDVLSSIRRLVTEDLRPRPVAATEDKLLLTPALRVVPDAADAVAGPAEQTLDIDLDADLAAALVEDEPQDDANPQWDAGAAAEAAEDGAGPFPMFLHHANRVDLTAAAPADLAETVTTIGAAIPAEGYESETGDVMPVPEWPDTSWEAPAVLDSVEEAQVIAAPAEQPAEFAGEDATAPDWQADVADDAEAAALAALADDQAAPLTELDEDMLREIVRDIIREELQGTLGERITRNVRKLVRAEINRALLTQDIDPRYSGADHS
ncbi:MAG: hypothetical protein MUD11_00655 [Rhodobacteraceae bacterium]|jgi:hypothetical protein|nr:hypothetical protein [Paracoccaceae bacterium]